MSKPVAKDFLFSVAWVSGRTTDSKVVDFMIKKYSSALRAICGFAIVLVLTIDQAMAAPKSELWSVWQSSNEENRQTIDHGVWQTVLDRYLEPVQTEKASPPVTLFKYQAVSDQDKKRLKVYLHTLTGLDPRQYARDEQMAYWINLYNALTVNLVLEHYPVDSIRDIKSGWFSFGPWDKKLVTIQGEELTLNDIEHRILRPIWEDKRIHYAVNCASLGCPNLSAEAFTGENLESLLEQAAHDFINHPRGVRIEGDELILSSIYDWYQVDFGGSLDGVKTHLLQYAEPELKNRLTGHRHSVNYHYDWSLNQPR